MTQRHNKVFGLEPGQAVPWYRQFWPWFIIALPASAVIASMITFWLAVSNPDPLVLKNDDYRQLNSELKAQSTIVKEEKTTNPKANSD